MTNRDGFHLSSRHLYSAVRVKTTNGYKQNENETPTRLNSARSTAEKRLKR